MTKQKLTKQQMIDRINELNGLLEERRAALLPQYEKVLLASPRDAEGLALRLADKFQNFSMTIMFDRGYKSVTATPRRIAWQPSDRADPSTVIVLAEEQLSAGGPWCSYQELRAYAEGYNDAAVARIELEKLKARLEEYRTFDQRAYQMQHPFFNR